MVPNGHVLPGSEPRGGFHLGNLPWLLRLPSLE
jgi:hypothetical protein